MTTDHADPDSSEAAIPVRSRAQAREWSLVLISQGIEATIDRKDGDWMLLVEPPELARALDAIKKYQAENRGWRWHRRVFKPGLVFDWMSTGWVVLIIAFYLLDLRFDFRSVGIL